MRKFFILITLVFYVAVSGFAGGDNEKDSVPSEGLKEASGRITLYTSVPQVIVDKMQEDFHGKYPGITLDVFRAGTSSVITKLMTEKEAGEIKADLLWVAEPSTYENFKDQGLLLKFIPDEASNLSDEMKDPEGYYYAGRLINMIIGYNTLKISDPPKGWEDLLRKDYKKIGFPTPIRSGAALAAVETLRGEFGWDYFENFAKAGGKQMQSNSTVRDKIVTGELYAGVLLDYMVRPLMAKGSPINYIWPEEGAVFIPSPLGIMKSSTNPEAAEVFVNYVLSKDGQESVVKMGNFYPVREDVAPPEGAPSIANIVKLPTDWKTVKSNTNTNKEKWIEIFGN